MSLFDLSLFCAKMLTSRSTARLGAFNLTSILSSSTADSSGGVLGAIDEKDSTNGFKS
jgi:hypothetical protein